jgi:hypothetical protein
MLKRNSRGTWLLLMVLFALVLAACSPAGGGDLVGEETAAEAEAAAEDEPTDPAGHAETDQDGADHEATAASDDDSAAVEDAASRAEEPPGGDDSAGNEDTDISSADEDAETAEGEPESENSAADNETVADTVNDADDNAAAEEPGSSDEDSESAEIVILTEDDRNERQRLISERWTTDWNRHTVPYGELLALLPVRDGIPALDDPKYISPEEAAAWLAGVEPVIAFEQNGDARAYPLQIMTYHEIVNDMVGDLPVTVTFCPLCNSAIVFDRRLGGEVYDFGTSGWLRRSDLVMYDRQTESLWQQFTGEGIVGELAGEQLTFLPSSIVSFDDFREAFPDGLILSRETGHQRPYGQNPYPGYDRIGENPFAFLDVPDGRLAAMERVITVSLDDVDVAYPLTTLFEAGVIHDNQAGQDLVIFHEGGTASALDMPIIQMGADVGATGVFDPNLNGEKLTFLKDDDTIKDEQTGSKWNILGQATDGPLAGDALAPLVHGDHFWFAWAAFQPETIIFGS